MLFAVAVGAAIGALTRSFSAEATVRLATVVVPVAGLLVAVVQWRRGLGEKALDALYDRIELANRMQREALQSLDADEEEKTAADRLERYTLFVYTEIDSLEYAVRRYRFGLSLNADIVHRAVRHFRSRCASSETFMVTAAECISQGAYFEDTKITVGLILGEERAKRARPVPTPTSHR